MTDFNPQSSSKSKRIFTGSSRVNAGFKSYDFFKVIQYGTVTLSSPNSAGSSTNVSITHNLGYQPLVIAFVSFSPTGTRYPLPYLSPVLPTTGTIQYQISLEVVSSTIVTFFHRDIAGASNLTDYISYYIMGDTAT